MDKDTKIPASVNSPLTNGLREPVEYVIDEGNLRINTLKARTKIFQDAEKQGREPSEEEEQTASTIVPSPAKRESGTPF